MVCSASLEVTDTIIPFITYFKKPAAARDRFSYIHKHLQKQKALSALSFIFHISGHLFLGITNPSQHPRLERTEVLCRICHTNNILHRNIQHICNLFPINVLFCSSFHFFQFLQKQISSKKQVLSHPLDNKVVRFFTICASYEIQHTQSGKSQLAELSAKNRRHRQQH